MQNKFTGHLKISKYLNEFLKKYFTIHRAFPLKKIFSIFCFHFIISNLFLLKKSVHPFFNPKITI